MDTGRSKIFLLYNVRRHTVKEVGWRERAVHSRITASVTVAGKHWAIRKSYLSNSTPPLALFSLPGRYTQTATVGILSHRCIWVTGSCSQGNKHNNHNSSHLFHDILVRPQVFMICNEVQGKNAGSWHSFNAISGSRAGRICRLDLNYHSDFCWDDHVADSQGQETPRPVWDFNALQLFGKIIPCHRRRWTFILAEEGEREQGRNAK